ncbi:MAG: hypothetical protein ACR2OU_13150 [Thermomicrobiales bacterium]
MTDDNMPVVAAYLTGEGIGFRAPRIEDATSANVWMIDASRPWAMGFGFPRAKEGAEKQLREEEVAPWGSNDTLRLVAVELATGDILGGAVVQREHGRTGWIRSQVATWIDPDEATRLELEMATLLIAWARTELDLMVIEYVVAADRPKLEQHILGQGFIRGTRLREALQRPQGRVDVLWLESVNEQWGARIVHSEVPING